MSRMTVREAYVLTLILDALAEQLTAVADSLLNDCDSIGLGIACAASEKYRAAFASCKRLISHIAEVGESDLLREQTGTAPAEGKAGSVREDNRGADATGPNTCSGR